MAHKPQAIEITATSEKDAQKQTARICINPSINAAMILNKTHKSLEPDLIALKEAVDEELSKVLKGDISAIERMLMAQALTLQSIFTSYTHRMLSAEYISGLQVNSKIALKAQNQCRQTLAALAEIKNPKRTTFIKNTATNQQVNFNANSPEKNQNKSNELLTGNNYAPMDITGTATPSGINQEMAAVEA